MTGQCMGGRKEGQGRGIARFLDAINEQIVSGRYYDALKLTRKLINEEERLIQHADSGAGLPEHP